MTTISPPRLPFPDEQAEALIKEARRHRRRRWLWSAAATLLCVAIVVAVLDNVGSGNRGVPSPGSHTHHSAPPQTGLGLAPHDAVQTASAWLSAINSKDAPLAASYVQARNAMDWDNGVTADWPTFSDVSCSPLTSLDVHNDAKVNCVFNESGSPGTQLDGFWTILLDRQPDGEWLVTDWGTP